MDDFGLHWLPVVPKCRKTDLCDGAGTFYRIIPPYCLSPDASNNPVLTYYPAESRCGRNNLSNSPCEWREAYLLLYHSKQILANKPPSLYRMPRLNCYSDFGNAIEFIKTFRSPSRHMLKHEWIDITWIYTWTKSQLKVYDLNKYELNKIFYTNKCANERMELCYVCKYSHFAAAQWCVCLPCRIESNCRSHSPPNSTLEPSSL